MATASAPNAADCAAPSSSYFRKTVCLREWWLIKAEQDCDGKRLAVAGFTSQDKKSVRAFNSAPILSRSDPLTLETADGIYVIIDSCLNKVRTEENGFPYEVFSHFVFGFPANWEEYAEKCSVKELGNKDVSTSSDCDKLSTDSGTAGSEERHGTSDHMSVSSEEKGHHKPPDDVRVRTPNCNKAAISEDRHGASNTMDVSSEERRHHRPRDGACNDSSLDGNSPSVARRMLNCSLSRNKSKLKVKGYPKTVKPVEYEDTGLTCGSNGKINMTNAAKNGKRTSGCRSASIPSAVGLQPTRGETEQEDGNIARQAGKESKNAGKTPRSSVGLSNANQIDDLKVAGSKKVTNVKNASKSKEKTQRKLTYESPVTKIGTEKTTFVSPESSNFRRSRSGRLLLPSLQFWRNQLVIYDADHQITGIQEGPRCAEPSRGSRSEPQRKRGKVR